MRKYTVLLFVVACTLLALYATTGCSGGLDAMQLQNLGSEALNIDDSPDDDTGVDAEDVGSQTDPNSTVTVSIHENLICTDEEVEDADSETQEQVDPPRLTTGGNIELTRDPVSLCGRHISPTQTLSTHEPVFPFQTVVFCDNTQVPLNNPHLSCSAISDISYSYTNIPVNDFGVCILKLDDQVASALLFVYRNNGVELTRHEILRTCVERMSCLMGVFRSAVIPLIEAANESTITSSDITFTVLRTVDNYVVEASDMGNLANAVLVLDDVELPIDDDIVSHNQHHVDTVITFIEDNCVE